MCGIAGVFAYHEDAPPVSRMELERMNAAMANRGPDGFGQWINPIGNLGLTHRRLAILDLSDQGTQPMQSGDGPLTIVFNGEIYNFRELRKELQTQGYTFRSNSDTEVILALYHSHGADLVHKLRGMYAFAIWDAPRNGLFLARDPFGIKPLYYANDGRTFRFASQVKILSAGGSTDPSPDAAGFAGFFALGFIPEPFTTLKAVKSLPAGHRLWIDQRGSQTPEPFFSLTHELALAEETSRRQTIPEDEVRERLHAALVDTARYHLVSDVPMGVFLSAGLDSSALLSLATEVGGRNLHTVTLGFREFKGSLQDETTLAAQVAEHFQAQHSTQWVDRQAFNSSFDHALQSMDQPSVDGLNTYFVSKAAADAGLKVAWSGLGGDELFGGYPSFHQVPRLVRHGGILGRFSTLGRGVRNLIRPFTGRRISPKWASIMEMSSTMPRAYYLRRGLYMPWEFDALAFPLDLREGWQKLDLLTSLARSVDGLTTSRAQVMALEMGWFMRSQLLRDADWASMAHSLEMRVPLLDVGLFRAVAPLLVATLPATKQHMVASLHHPLPHAILNRSKTGFCMPIRQWAEQNQGKAGKERGLRGWSQTLAQRTLPEYRPVNALESLLLTSDGFGGHGGIALYNRDLAWALHDNPKVKHVVGLPRLMPLLPEAIPHRVTWDTRSLGGKGRYVLAVLRYLLVSPRTDLVICALINLAPLAVLTQRIKRAKSILFIYGIDAWTEHPSWMVRWATRRMDGIVSISQTTMDRFQKWAEIPQDRCFVLPNAIHLEAYGTGPKPGYLMERYAIEKDAIVLMTLGRMASYERYKGFDQIIELLPALHRLYPNLIYLMVGDGTDRERLALKCNRLGVSGQVRFTGMIPESEKADHYRLADSFALPSRGEGFGYVLLEAMACGIPVVASRLDGSREAVLDGALGELVDPDDPTDILNGIQKTLVRPKGIPIGLQHFAFPAFKQHFAAILSSIMQSRQP